MTIPFHGATRFLAPSGGSSALGPITPDTAHSSYTDSLGTSHPFPTTWSLALTPVLDGTLPGYGFGAPPAPAYRVDALLTLPDATPPPFTFLSIRFLSAYGSGLLYADTYSSSFYPSLQVTSSPSSPVVNVTNMSATGLILPGASQLTQLQLLTEAAFALVAYYDGGSAYFGSNPPQNQLGSSVAGRTLTSWNIDWGDGSTDSVTSDAPLASHRYDFPGLYPVTVVATDNFGWQSLPLRFTLPAQSVSGRASGFVHRPSGDHFGVIVDTSTLQTGPGGTSRIGTGAAAIVRRTFDASGSATLTQFAKVADLPFVSQPTLWQSPHSGTLHLAGRNIGGASYAGGYNNRSGAGSATLVPGPTLTTPNGPWCVWSSDDEGLTWSVPMTTSFDSSFSVTDWEPLPWGGAIGLAWKNVPPAPGTTSGTGLYAAVSWDLNTWETPVLVHLFPTGFIDASRFALVSSQAVGAATITISDLQAYTFRSDDCGTTWVMM